LQFEKVLKHTSQPVVKQQFNNVVVDQSGIGKKMTDLKGKALM